MNATDLGKLDRDALIALILKQAAIIKELRAEIEALKPSGKRQAAPFSTGTRAKDPKRPGRKPGQGLFKTREAPAAETLSEPPIDVPVAETECPKCGGELDEGRVAEASMTDLPEVVRPRVRLFRVLQTVQAETDPSDGAGTPRRAGRRRLRGAAAAVEIDADDAPSRPIAFEPRQPATPERTRPLPRHGLAGAVPRRPVGRADEQPRRATVASRGLLA